MQEFLEWLGLEDANGANIATYHLFLKMGFRVEYMLAPFAHLIAFILNLAVIVIGVITRIFTDPNYLLGKVAATIQTGLDSAHFSTIASAIVILGAIVHIVRTAAGVNVNSKSSGLVGRYTFSPSRKARQKEGKLRNVAKRQLKDIAAVFVPTLVALFILTNPVRLINLALSGLQRIAAAVAGTPTGQSIGEYASSSLLMDIYGLANFQRGFSGDPVCGPAWSQDMASNAPAKHSQVLSCLGLTEVPTANGFTILALIFGAVVIVVMGWFLWEAFQRATFFLIMTLLSLWAAARESIAALFEGEDLSPKALFHKYANITNDGLIYCAYWLLCTFLGVLGPSILMRAVSTTNGNTQNSAAGSILSLIIVAVVMYLCIRWLFPRLDPSRRKLIRDTTAPTSLLELSNNFREEHHNLLTGAAFKDPETGKLSWDATRTSAKEAIRNNPTFQQFEDTFLGGKGTGAELEEKRARERERHKKLNEEFLADVRSTNLEATPTTTPADAKRNRDEAHLTALGITLGGEETPEDYFTAKEQVQRLTTQIDELTEQITYSPGNVSAEDRTTLESLHAQRAAAQKRATTYQEAQHDAQAIGGTKEFTAPATITALRDANVPLDVAGNPTTPTEVFTALKIPAGNKELDAQHKALAGKLEAGKLLNSAELGAFALAYTDAHEKALAAKEAAAKKAAEADTQAGGENTPVDTEPETVDTADTVETRVAAINDTRTPTNEPEPHTTNPNKGHPDGEAGPLGADTQPGPRPTPTDTATAQALHEAHEEFGQEATFLTDMISYFQEVTHPDRQALIEASKNLATVAQRLEERAPLVLSPAESHDHVATMSTYVADMKATFANEDTPTDVLHDKTVRCAQALDRTVTDMVADKATLIVNPTVEETKPVTLVTDQDQHLDYVSHFLGTPPKVDGTDEHVFATINFDPSITFETPQQDRHTSQTINHTQTSGEAIATLDSLQVPDVNAHETDIRVDYDEDGNLEINPTHRGFEDNPDMT